MKKEKDFHDKMTEEWGTVSEFYRATKIPLAFETVRRAIHDKIPINAHSFILISYYLGYSSEEIKQNLLSPEGKIVDSDHAAARIFAELIGGSPVLTPRDKAVLSIAGKIRSNDQARTSFIESVKLLCKMANIEIGDELRVVTKKG